MYNKKLNELKVSDAESSFTLPIEEIKKLLDGFASRESLLYVPQKEIFKLFDNYCEEKGIFKLPHRAIGRAIRQKYNFESKVMRNNDEIIRIYVEAK